MGELEIEVYVRCDSDPYGIDKLVTNLRIGGECVHREQYYAVSGRAGE
jgi:DNA topoisomerase VI subunit A